PGQSRQEHAQVGRGRVRRRCRRRLRRHRSDPRQRPRHDPQHHRIRPRPGQGREGELTMSDSIEIEAVRGHYSTTADTFATGYDWSDVALAAWLDAAGNAGLPNAT